LIVKNEAAYLPGCLDSLSDRVDEIVIVDTGSTDGTVAIASRGGALVLSHPWDGDFSAARNAGLERARGDWILYIDADERLEAPGQGSIGHFLPSRGACAVRLRFQPSVDATDYTELRLWRNDPRIRFKEVMHERVVESVRQVCASDGSSVANVLDIRLCHLGYEGDQNHKHSRNLPLLRKALELNPERVYCWYHLGITLAAIGEEEEAVDCLRQAVGLARRSHHPEDRNIAGMALQCLAGLAMDCNAPEHALREADSGLELCPYNFALRWARARALVALDRAEEALAILHGLTQIDADTFFDPRVSFNKRLFREDASGLLGAALFKLGRNKEAAHYFRLAERQSGNAAEFGVKAALAEVRAGIMPGDQKAC
jgi:tetratricopeptide (TPR) repeat protein